MFAPLFLRTFPQLDGAIEPSDSRAGTSTDGIHCDGTNNYTLLSRRRVRRRDPINQRKTPE